MQYLLTQEEMDKLKGAIESKEPKHATAFAADFEQMLHNSKTQIIMSHEFLNAEVLNLQVKLSDVPTPLRQLIERHVRTR